MVESTIRYSKLEDINSEFAQADIAFVIGANDVTNPAAVNFFANDPSRIASITARPWATVSP
jgi:NAD/NADP transhydrogenase beta subunit